MSFTGETGRQACPDGGILCDWLGEQIWLSLVGSKLEMGTNLGKLAVINQVLATAFCMFSLSEGSSSD